MTSRNAFVARFALSTLFSTGLLLTPAVAWSDDAGVDATEDVAVDATADVPVAPVDAASPTDGAARPDATVTDGGSDGARAGAGGSGAGGAAGATVIPEDDAGCSTAGPTRGSSTGLLALLATAAAFLGITTYRRRRSRR